MTAFVFSTFQVPGQSVGTAASVGGINDFGQIAGTFTDASGRQRIFVRTGGRYDTVLVSQTDSGLTVTGINNLDLVVGSTNTLFSGVVVTQQFDPFSGQFGTAASFVSPYPNYPVSGGVNDAGQIAGNSQLVIPSGTTPGQNFLVRAGTFTPLQVPLKDNAYAAETTTINDSGQIAGSYDVIISQAEEETGSVGFIDTAGTIGLVSVPGATFTDPTAINNLGEVAGNASPGPYGPSVGFVDTGGTITTLQYPGATETVVTGLNDLGQVVGEYFIEGTSFSSGPFVATPASPPTR